MLDDRMADKITINDDSTLNVSDNPIIPFIEGDGIGPDIWAAAVRVFDAATRALVATLPGLPDDPAVTHLAFSPDGARLASASR